MRKEESSERSERGKSIPIHFKASEMCFRSFLYLLGHSVVRMIYCTTLGICDPDAFLKVKLLKLLDIGLKVLFGRSDIRISGAEEIDSMFGVFSTTPLTSNLILNVFKIKCYLIIGLVMKRWTRERLR